MQELFEETKCFKLICGATNTSTDEIEKLVAIYSKAGCRFFDFAADLKTIEAAQKGLDFSIPKSEQKDYHFCISVGIKDDPHFRKAEIDYDKCKHCEQCVIACPQKAISSYFKVDKNKCVGCLKCLHACKHGAIKIYNEHPSTDFSSYSDFNVSCVELHATSEDTELIEKAWDDLNQNFSKMLSLCIGRTKLGDEKLLSLAKKLVLKRKPYTTIIQADGTSISGGEDDYKTTLQAIASAQLIQNAKLPCYVIMSGGTNSKTAELANLCKVQFDGISMGSFARTTVREYIEKENLLKDNLSFEKAVEDAKRLIDSVIN